MPEGDTIFRAAATLHRALAGRRVIRFESVFPALTRVDHDRPLAGRLIEDVSAAGKHVLMRFERDLILRTHMRMNGSWHLYRPGDRWKRPRRDMRIVIATDAFDAVGFNVPVAEFLEGARAVARQDDLRLMGPMLLAESFDADAALARVREKHSTAIADVLLNQRVVAGIGNVYKSEALFVCRIDPFRTAGDLSDDAVREILATSRRLLRVNVSDPRGGIVTYRGYRRTTNRANPSEGLYVYGRAGKPCRRCGTSIQVKAQGPHARLTYWCENCQR
jgi:endonuclease-8